MVKLCAVFVVIISMVLCDAYKILVVFPLPVKSHGILGEGVVRHLLNAGHEVTYITPYPKNATHPMLHEVDLSEALKGFEPVREDMNLKKVIEKKVTLDVFRHLVWPTGNMIASQMLGYDNFQMFLADTTQHFDVIIVEWLFSDLYTTLAAVYDVPLILSSSIEPHWMIISLIDEALNPAYNGYSVTVKPPFTFAQRAEEFFFTFLQTITRNTVGRFLDSRSYHRLVAPHIIARGRTPPDYIDLLYNASLIIGNSHVSMGEAKTLPQNYISVGGYHIQETTNTLPANLKKIIEDAEYGVIYFSMGSNLNSTYLPEEIKQGILEVFGSLKQTVLWKFEEQLPRAPPNLHIIDWAPQQSILAHPNVVLFITHGGLLSTTEAIYAGKPIIGIPVFSDQFVNIDRAVSRGFAKKVDLSYNMAHDLKIALDEVLGNPKYSERVKELSVIYHDRPMKPGPELVHWVEHVIKTGGARHLRSPALMVAWYQKLYLDLALLVVAIAVALNYTIGRVIRTFNSKKNYSKKVN